MQRKDQNFARTELAESKRKHVEAGRFSDLANYDHVPDLLHDDNDDADYVETKANMSYDLGPHGLLSYPFPVKGAIRGSVVVRMKLSIE